MKLGSNFKFDLSMKTINEEKVVSFLNSDNSNYLEEKLESFLAENNEHSKKWRSFLEATKSNKTDSNQTVKEFFKLLAVSKLNKKSSNAVADNSKFLAVIKLIENYRYRGHQLADLNPLDRVNYVSGSESVQVRELDLDFLGLDEADLNKAFSIPDFNQGNPLSLQQIINSLKEIYCSNIGYEYAYIPNTTKKQWFINKIENTNLEISNEEKLKIFERLTASEGLEKHLHTRYLGQKRFSLEGGDSTLVALDAILKSSTKTGVEEIILGMAHRGRLNVLINTLGKQPSELFEEFEGKKANKIETGFSSDVKYHLGYSSDLKIDNKSMHLVLGFNPSHLAIVTPVIEGSVRARQDNKRDTLEKQTAINDDEKKEQIANSAMSVIIHGDAAFAGQGVIMETLNMTETRGYSTKGTVHIVINNQIGFTTSAVIDARSTMYCTDVAKMINAPIIHVNGDNPEAVYKAALLAMEYRNEFKADVVLDLVCYRRHGHNEGDEPQVTQPMMYKAIKTLPTTRSLYEDKLISENLITKAESEASFKKYRKKLDDGQVVAPYIEKDSKLTKERETSWKNFAKSSWDKIEKTGLPLKNLKSLATLINTIPENIKLHSRVEKIVKDRLAMAKGEKLADWGFAENLAYATLLNEDYAVRISGQDAGRGTFFHRHAVIHNQEDGERYLPLLHVSEQQAAFTVIDSLLSEEAVLAFEYGYATTKPKTLTIWEAQFGDFANGAQVVIDQFIASGEVKWLRYCGLVMLLPHGYEGQGPEHSSARLERFLQLCAENNMYVAYPTTPKQIYHLLRLHMHRKLRKPLVIMSPKSLLRHPDATSSLEELAKGRFEFVLDDPRFHKQDVVKGIEKLIITFGKVYFDLEEKRIADKIDKVAILRLENLYPFPRDVVEAILKKYPDTKQVVWVQEEPENQGAWRTTRHRLELSIKNSFQTPIPLKYAGRQDAASPAVGYSSVHVKQQEQLVQDAFDF